MKNIAWTMSVETAMEFYRRCMEQNAETEEQEVRILMDLAGEGRMTSVVATNKTQEEYIQDKAKHFDILQIKKAEDDNA